MSVCITVNRICDRCLRPFDGSRHEAIADVAEFERQDQYVLTRADRKSGEVTTLFDYQDLCDTCDGVVTKALAKLRLSRIETDRASFALPTEESSQESEPAVEETPVETAPTPAPTPKESSPKKLTRKEMAAKVAENAEKKLAEDRESAEIPAVPPEAKADEDELPF